MILTVLINLPEFNGIDYHIISGDLRQWSNQIVPKLMKCGFSFEYAFCVDSVILLPIGSPPSSYPSVFLFTWSKTIPARFCNGFHLT